MKELKKTVEELTEEVRKLSRELTVHQWKRREIISFFLITVLAGESLKIGLESFNKTIDKFECSIDFFINYWTIPIIFLTNLLRLYIGNILYLIDLKRRTATAFPWITTVFVFFIQFSLLVLIGMRMDSQRIFYNLLMFLLSIDIIWILVIWILKKKGVESFKDLFVAQKWAVLNLYGILVILFKIENYWNYIYIDYAIGLLFIIIFIFDISFDYFRLFKN